ncbi:hypothetical protein [Burkholderia gladioli]|uniref:hypothetical protein n=1 Tax=Burkholderia gladioli TaxID=28095 RepID=UPI001642E109|nr:hypothetical protein [Burkholderia gladioli]
MQTISQLIKAGADYAANLKGLTLFVQQCDQGDVLTITLVDALGNRYAVQDIGAGAKLRPLAGFTSVQISTPIDANVQFIITSGDIDIQNSQVESVIANGDGSPVPVRVPAGQRLPVDIGGGTVNVTASNVTVGNAPANPVPIAAQPAGSAAAEAGGVAVGTATGAGAVLAAAAGRKRAIFYNAGPGKVALTASNTVAFASAALILQPGDAWKETDAPHIAWYAISDTGSTLNIQTVS